jgi:hypothetical protein
MAKSISGKTREPGWYEKVNGRVDNQFVNYDLTPEQKVTFRGWMADNFDKLADMMHSVVAGGYSLSVKMDTKSDGYLVYLTCTDDKSVNKGWVLTSRGSHPLNAMLSVFWKHAVLFNEDWPKTGNRRYDMDDE